MNNDNSNNKQIDPGEIFYAWVVDEYDTHERTAIWYIVAGLITFIFLIFAVFTKNFLFAVIIIFAGLILILRDGGPPDKVQVAIAAEGLVVGQKFHDYDDFKNFAIVYKPNFNAKNLYFEFKNPIRQRLSIPLEDNDPLPIRKILLKYLPEDTERTDIPLSEQLARRFKL
jgi:hypothetical protein